MFKGVFGRCYVQRGPLVGVTRTVQWLLPRGSCRGYATPADADVRDQELLDLLHSYPAGKGASPYEYLGYKSPKHFDARKLKKRFHQLAKIYHPDSSSFDGISLKKQTFFLTNENGEAAARLTQVVKSQRFKKILSAYTLLKNPMTRSNYDNYAVGWEDNSSGLHCSPNPNYHSPSSAFYNRTHTQQSHHHAYTGTWEDYWKDPYHDTYDFKGDHTWQAEGETFKENLYNNRKNITISVLLFVGVYAALQATHVYLYDDYMGSNAPQTYSSDEVHEKARKHLLAAHDNYGMGMSKDDRINRFLWFRRISMLLNLGEFSDVVEHLKHRQLVVRDKDGAIHVKEFDRAQIKEGQPECAPSQNS